MQAQVPHAIHPPFTAALFRLLRGIPFVSRPKESTLGYRILLCGLRRPQAVGIRTV